MAFRTEAKVKIALSVLVSFLVILPQFWAYFKTPPGYFFGGINILDNLSDIQGIYFPAMHQFSQGGWLFQNPHDSQSKPVILHLVYLVLGKISGLFYLPIPLTFNLAAALLAFFFSLLIFKFAKLFFGDFKDQLFTWFLAIFGGFYLIGIPEGVGFFSLVEPHFIIAQAGLFWCFYLIIRLTNQKSLPTSRFLQFTIAATAVGLIHPWMLLLIWTFLAVWSALQLIKKQLTDEAKFLGVLTLITFTILFYYTKIASLPYSHFPHPSDLLLLASVYGIWLILSFWGIFKTLKTKAQSKYTILLLWTLMHIAFIFLPFTFQRRFFEGLYLPLAIWAVVGIKKIFTKINKKYPSNSGDILLVFLLSSGIITRYALLFSWLPNELVYRNVGEKAVYEYLDKNADSSSQVLTIPEAGNFLVSMANVKVYLGNNILTPQSDFRTKTVFEYFTGRMDRNSRKKFIEEQHICYVYLDSNTKKIAINLDTETYLSPVYKNGSVLLYKTQWCTNKISSLRP